MNSILSSVSLIHQQPLVSIARSYLDADSVSPLNLPLPPRSSPAPNRALLLSSSFLRCFPPSSTTNTPPPLTYIP
ncbi:hypothetical protein CBS11852_5338 [Aspergillus niger]|nr:hypothetical protein CBS11852_5338 [Aspergillus niger]